ncbi:hypothetical protein [Streptacidiphilus neutrinimicus]|uniref:hypothetical protein n=1 Tax=Streptacidiphilus neutrinimicus TaxID=105420 RepID=UPI000A3FCEBC|nr:hypothetical protein [Streptacidiphilus neutrinimicus]
MSIPDERDNDQVDDETRQRSAEQRNITAPTPKDVRAKGDDEDDDANEPPSTDG